MWNPKQQRHGIQTWAQEDRQVLELPPDTAELPSHLLEWGTLCGPTVLRWHLRHLNTLSLLTTTLFSALSSPGLQISGLVQK